MGTDRGKQDWKESSYQCLNTENEGKKGKSTEDLVIFTYKNRISPQKEEEYWEVR